MKILRVDELNEATSVSDGILIIVDVQTAFNKFMPNNYIQNLFKYCETGNNGGAFDVYQIWDSNRSTKPSYTFPNQKGAYEKKFGIKKYYSIKNPDGTPKFANGFFDWINVVFEPDVAKQINDISAKNALVEGNSFKMKDGGYLVYIGNNHKWFFVNAKLCELFTSLKGKNVVIVGGAANECLKDVFISAKSFGIIPTYNDTHIYSVKTRKY